MNNMNELDKTLLSYAEEVEVYDRFLRKPELPVEILQAIYEAKMRILEEVEEILQFEIKH
jgi:hypothetical protein